ncbi:MAG: beta family protein [Endomicrobium sp.]|jgi:hypothetical protein|nr:beta family protein [Endomicrobium sp.]
MIKGLSYMPIIKTGDAEMRGVSNLPISAKKSIIPMFELTRYRKVRRKVKGFEEKQEFEFPLDKRIDKIETSIGKDNPFFIDLTGDDKLSNDKIRELQNSKDGYSAWCQFLAEQKQRFSKIIPVLQVSDEGSKTIEQSQKNLKLQVEFLSKNYDYFLYRFPITDQYYEADLNVIMSICDKSKIICCVDMAFIQKGQGIVSAQAIYDVISKINKNYAVDNFIVSGTSFPQTITSDKEFNEFGEYTLEEVKLFNEIKKLNQSNLNLYYSDYACINPIRTDIMASGWIPKIDCPDKESWFFHRKKKGSNEYAVVYAEVANLMTADDRYKNVKKLLGSECWGIEQIETASSGLPSGLSPSFWISVRLNLAISLRTAILSQPINKPRQV